MKICCRCKKEKQLAEFDRAKRSKDGRRGACKTCRSKYQHKLRSGPKAKVKQREGNLKNNYGISIADYSKMHREQDGVCAICREPETRIHKGEVVLQLSVDHDHKTGMVRQLLCNRCNSAIGYFRDSPELTERAALYLRKHQQRMTRLCQSRAGLPTN